jgi:hypothetical protein
MVSSATSALESRSTTGGACSTTPDLASAILDRVLERGRWITLDGPSGRTKHLKLDPAIPQDGPGAIVPEMWCQSFRNPQHRQTKWILGSRVSRRGHTATWNIWQQ